MAKVNINGRPVTSGSVGYSGRVVLSDHNIHGDDELYVGTSVLASSSMTMTSVFAGVGIEDRVSLMAEVLMMKSTGLADTRNSIIALMVKVLDGVYLEGRARKGNPNLPSPSSYESTVTQWVIGAQVFLLYPSFEIRPDYRIVETGCHHNCLINTRPLAGMCRSTSSTQHFQLKPIQEVTMSLPKALVLIGLALTVAMASARITNSISLW
ncbi:MAG: hypothetical protein IPI29_06450 [Ignavibacteria bacterium]|nr:hypothetical protein [Ignavibacteria bacterium]